MAERLKGLAEESHLPAGPAGPPTPGRAAPGVAAGGRGKAAPGSMVSPALLLASALVSSPCTRLCGLLC